MSRRAIGGVSLIGLAVLCALIPMPATAVERWYSTSLYPAMQRIVTPVSNAIPFAVLDLLLLSALIFVVSLLWRAGRQARRDRRLAPLLSAAAHLSVAAAIVYLAFLLLWGLNYRRMPMHERLVLNGSTADADAVRALGLQAVAEVNRLHDEAHRVGWADHPWRDEHLREAFAATQRALSDASPAVPGRLKRSLLGLYFRWAGIDGMVDPLALEVLANPDLLPWERPFVAAHEWAHLAGYAHEAEANFVGWLTSVRADVPSQYSGWLYLYWQIASEVSRADREQLWHALDQGPREDIEAIAERMRRGQLPFLRTTSWRVYDGYLRANRVDGGVRAYGEVVNLILRTTFEDEWTPVRRPALR